MCGTSTVHSLAIALLIAIGAEVVPPIGCDGTPSERHAGYLSQGGWTLPQYDGKEFGVEYLCRESEAIVLFQVLQSITPEGMPVWKTLAERKLTVPKGDGLLVVAGCTFKGEDDPEIVPIGHYTQSGMARVTRAFRANRAREALEPIAAVSVRCEVEGD